MELSFLQLVAPPWKPAFHPIKLEAPRGIESFAPWTTHRVLTLSDKAHRNSKGKYRLLTPRIPASFRARNRAGEAECCAR